MIARVVGVVGQLFTVSAMIEKLKYIHGVWANVVELGISDEVVWRAMNLAWQIWMSALMANPACQSTVHHPPPDQA